MYKLWEILSGKKRTIALIYWAVLVPSMAVIWPNGYITDFSLIFFKVVTIVGLFLSALGLGHAAVKTNNKRIKNNEKKLNQNS